LHDVPTCRRRLPAGNVVVFFQEMSVTKDKIVFPFNERTANLWMIER
jgi:hypothetical protein